MQNSTPLPAVGFVRLATLLPIVAISRAKVWRDVKSGKFPTPIRVSENVTAWRVEDIRAWLADPQGWAKGGTK